VHKASLFAALFAASFIPALLAQQPTPVALTIYNQDFAVARTSIDLDLHPGLNEVTTTGVTSRLEPDSVVLRDPTGKRIVQVLEQNYDAAVVNQEWLLQKYEGKTIDFQVGTQQGFQTVQGKIIRAGSQGQPAYNEYGQYQAGQIAQPLIEVNGKMQFQLPGLPLFPAATDGLLLKPTLRWQIQSEKSDHFTAELAYITGGLDWEATYNVVVPNSTDVTGDEKADVIGWVTIHNQSGTEFPQARIKLMAGDVAKLPPENRARAMGYVLTANVGMAGQPQVTQKPFDDFHLYDLNRTVALRDGEPSRSNSSMQPMSPSAATISTTALRPSYSPITTTGTSTSSEAMASTTATPRSTSSNKSRTANRIISACHYPQAASVSIAATPTAKWNS
jgi:hypothetical protein